MKLATFIKDGQEAIGIVAEGKLFPIDQKKLGCANMLELIENYTDLQEELRKMPLDPEQGLALDAVQLAAPIPRPRHDVICLGMNYLEHAKETARFRGRDFKAPQNAIYFSKRVNRALGHGETIPNHSAITQHLDYESELAVIIGKTCFGVSREDALGYIFGYTIGNDVSARNIQKERDQFYFGKGLDGFTPMGPYIVTADELPDASSLKISSKISGELRQNSDTSQLIFDIPHIISDLSQGITLEPGDIIFTGTPSGVGMGFDPPLYLKSGDTILCEIEGIGALYNVVE